MTHSAVRFLASLIVHVLVMLLGSVLFHHNNARRRDFLPIDLVDVPRPETPPDSAKSRSPTGNKKAAPIPSAKSSGNQSASCPAREIPSLIRKRHCRSKDKIRKIGAKPATPAQIEPSPSFASGATYRRRRQRSRRWKLVRQRRCRRSARIGNCRRRRWHGSFRFRSRFRRTGSARAADDSQNQPRSQTAPNRTRNIPSRWRYAPDSKAM